MVSSDIIAQFGVLFLIILGETLRHPIRHIAFLVVIMVAIVSTGVGIGVTIQHLLPGTGIVHFVVECALWLAAVALIASPLANKSLRNKLVEAIPR